MVIIPIKSDIDVFGARREGRRMAEEIGFNSSNKASVEIAISELASNIIKHAVSGKISITPIQGGLEIISDDCGQGIEDVEKALKAGKSTKGLGIGLSGVKRVMDQMEIISEKGKGTKIIVRKWKTIPSHLFMPKQDYNLPIDGLMKYGVISIPALGSEVNGDAYVIREFDKKVLIAVIDALGHGERAYPVSQEAADYVQKNYMQSLSALIEGCHKVLRRTRGAVIGIISVDTERAKLTYSGVGNIGIKITGRSSVKPISVPGIVGHNFRKLLEQEFPYSKGDTIFIYSDGISDKFDPWEPELKGREPQAIAEQIVRKAGKATDDHTIVVAREK